MKKITASCVCLFALSVILPCVVLGASANDYREVQKAYIAYYGRPADPAGLEYWANRLASEGGSLGSIIEAFGNSQEFMDRFGQLGYDDLVNTIYMNLFNRDADDAGKQFYVQKLQSGQMTLQSIALEILYGAQGSDRTSVDNKVEVAAYFTEQVRNNPSCTYSGNQSAEEAKKVLHHVTSAPGSIQAGKILTDYRFCRVLKCPLNVTESLDVLSQDQKAFIATRGNPAIFFITFSTEELTPSGELVYSGQVRRVETWLYNNEVSGELQSVLFDNGYFVEQKTVGPYYSELGATQLSPSLFTPCTTEEEVVRILGEPTCIQQVLFGGRTYRAYRYNPTDTLTANSLYFENGILVQVEAGLSVASPHAGTDLCSVEQ